MSKKGKRMFDNNGFESLVWKAYWERVEADRAAWLKDIAEEQEALMKEQNQP